MSSAKWRPFCLGLNVLNQFSSLSTEGLMLALPIIPVAWPKNNATTTTQYWKVDTCIEERPNIMLFDVLGSFTNMD